MANISHTFFKLNGRERGLLGLVDYNSTSALSDYKQQKLAAVAKMRNFFGPQSKIFFPPYTMYSREGNTRSNMYKFFGTCANTLIL